jgi:hypothetical protein
VNAVVRQFASRQELASLDPTAFRRKDGVGGPGISARLGALLGSLETPPGPRWQLSFRARLIRRLRGGKADLGIDRRIGK